MHSNMPWKVQGRESQEESLVMGGQGWWGSASATTKKKNFPAAFYVNLASKEHKEVAKKHSAKKDYLLLLSNEMKANKIFFIKQGDQSVWNIRKIRVLLFFLPAFVFCSERC